MSTNSTLARPQLFGAINLVSATISHLHYKDPANWFNFFQGTKDILISDMYFTVSANTGGSPAKNTGTWRSLA